MARLVAIGSPIVPSPMNPTRSLMVAPRLDVTLDDRRGGPHRMAGAGHEQGQALPGVQQEWSELLQRHPAEARPEQPAADATEEQVALGLESTRIERLAIVAHEVELHRSEEPTLHGQAQALDDEGSVGGLEPVPLALAKHEVAAGIGPGHGPQEEAQHRGVDDLGAVVEDPPVAIHLIAVLAGRLRHRAPTTGTDGWRPTRRASRARASVGRPARR